MSISSDPAAATMGKGLDQPDERRAAADHGRIELTRLGDEPCVTIDVSGGAAASGAAR